MPKLPNRLRELRERAGLSAQQLADKVGTSTKQVYRLENGERRLTDKRMLRFSTALELPPSIFFGEKTLEVPHAQDIEPYLGDLQSATAIRSLSAANIELYRVVGEGLASRSGFEEGTIIAVDRRQVERHELEDLDVILIEDAGCLVLALHVGSMGYLTTRQGKPALIEVDHQAKIVGKVLNGSQNGPSTL